MKLALTTLLASAFMVSAALADGGLNGNAFGVKGKNGAAAPAAHVDAWHGIGPDHQGDTQPGDTAADRHNFENATAGGSDTNPAGGLY